MPGMATPQELDLLHQAPPEETDRLFLRLMIAHHQAAIPMAEAILERTDRPEVRQLAEAMEVSQQAQIQTMEVILRTLLGNSAKVELKTPKGSPASRSTTFAEVRGGVRVELDLNGLPKPNTFYPAHIHPDLALKERRMSTAARMAATKGTATSTEIGRAHV
jgi:type IV secretory pathway VirB10-like protein